MSEHDVVASQDWKKAVDFHGHVCPGLAIGFRAAQLGLERLREQRAVDEEIVAIVETNACGVDAVQVLSGCTYGKGNLLHRDYGKQVFTFAARRSGEAVRVSLKPEVLRITDRHRELIHKTRNNEATREEREEFWELHRRASMNLLSMNPYALFAISDVVVDVPPKAKIEESRKCDECGEPTMESLLKETTDGRVLCRPCSMAQ
jgi:formylmethanofuran dehydrogenase subunit E